MKVLTNINGLKLEASTKLNCETNRYDVMLTVDGVPATEVISIDTWRKAKELAYFVFMRRVRVEFDNLQETT